MMEAIQIAIQNTGSYIASLDPMKFGIAVFGLIFMGLILYEHVWGKLDWTDLITARGSTKVSLTKLLQLVGGLTGTWIVVFQTVHNQLSTELFFAYLLYVASIEGYSKFMAAKYGISSDAPQEEHSQVVKKNDKPTPPKVNPPAPKVDDVIDN